MKLSEVTPEFIDGLQAASIWAPTDGPRVTLDSWRVYSVELNGGEPTVHFVGDSGREGRVSSPVLSYINKQGTTRSRVYELYGPSGHSGSSDAAYVWGRWLRMNGSPAFKEITEQYE